MLIPTFLFQAEFNKAPFKNWFMYQKLVATVKSAGGFTFIDVLNAGHMVPLDQPLLVSEAVRMNVHVFMSVNIMIILYRHCIFSTKLYTMPFHELQWT